jgi:hypothetical protein
MKAEDRNMSFIKIIFGHKHFYVEETQDVFRYYNNDFDVIVNKNLIKNSVVIDKREGKHVVYSNIRVAHDLLVY